MSSFVLVASPLSSSDNGFVHLNGRMAMVVDFIFGILKSSVNVPHPTKVRNLHNAWRQHRVRCHQLSVEWCGPNFWVEPVPLSRVLAGTGAPGVANAPPLAGMDRSRRGCRRPANGGRRASGREQRRHQAGKTKDSEFRHPDAVAHMQGLTDEEAAEHPPVTRKAGGVHAEY